MRKFLLISALAVGTVYADIIPELVSISPCGSGCNTYSYEVSLNDRTMVTAEDDPADYFTIYDFAGYITGSIAAPTGWVGSAQGQGLTPSPITVPGGDGA